MLLPISVSGPGDTALIAADPAGRSIVVLGYLLVAAGPTVLTWKAGTTALTGPMSMAPGAPQVVAPGNGLDTVPILAALPGNALAVNSSAGVQVSGWLVWDLR